MKRRWASLEPWLVAAAVLASGPAVCRQAEAQSPDRTAATILPADIDRWQVQIVVGSPNNWEFVQGPATEGGLAGPAEIACGHVAFDSRGNMYVACNTFIQIVTKDGTARVLAGAPGIGGCTDGPAHKATFAAARDLALADDRTLYVVDEANFTLRKLENKDGQWTVKTVAGVPGQRGHRDGPAEQALFDAPFDSVAVSDDGVVYTMDADWLRKLDRGVVTTLNAGTGSANGPLAQARFRRTMSQGACLTFGNNGQLYVADRANMAVRKVDTKTGQVSTFAGCLPGVRPGPPRDGPATEARFHGGGGPYQAAYNRKHDFLLVKSADEDTTRIIRDGMMMTFGAANRASKQWTGPLKDVYGGYVTPVGVDPDGNVYLANIRGGSVIRKVCLTPLQKSQEVKR